MFAALATHPHQNTEERNEKLPVNMEPATVTSLDPEVVALKKQVKQLRQKVN